MCQIIIKNSHLKITVQYKRGVARPEYKEMDDVKSGCGQDSNMLATRLSLYTTSTHGGKVADHGMPCFSPS